LIEIEIEIEIEMEIEIEIEMEIEIEIETEIEKKGDKKIHEILLLLFFYESENRVQHTRVPIVGVDRSGFC
jgi:hypothetical protein